jgi:hypothetical protein
MYNTLEHLNQVLKESKAFKILSILFLFSLVLSSKTFLSVFGGEFTVASIHIGFICILIDIVVLLGVTIILASHKLQNPQNQNQNKIFQHN